MPEFKRAIIRKRPSVGLGQAGAEGKIGGRRRKLAAKQRRKIAGSVASRRKSGAEKDCLYGVSERTVSRIVVAYRKKGSKDECSSEYAHSVSSTQNSATNGVTGDNK